MYEKYKLRPYISIMTETHHNHNIIRFDNVMYNIILYKN